MSMSKGKAAAAGVAGAATLALAAGTGATAATLITSKLSGPLALPQNGTPYAVAR
jgi:hypothetical protein